MKALSLRNILLAFIFLTGLSGFAEAQDNLNTGNPVDELIFPGDEPAHKVVYQFNKADWAYQESVLFSVGAMLRKYGDNIRIVVVAIGPGIHILAKDPNRAVPPMIKSRVASLAQYGVEFHACGNTMKTQGWGEDDMLPFSTVVEVGAADLMELQEQGYAYINW